MARGAQLPPLQSVAQLTSASAPPQRGEVPVTAQAALSSAGTALQKPVLITCRMCPEQTHGLGSRVREVSCAGQAMEDGKGVLEDGTRYVRESGEDFGPNGFWKRWTRLAGVSAQGKVRPCPAKHAEMQENAPLQAWMLLCMLWVAGPSPVHGS